MKSTFYHLQINIDFANVSFYKNLMSTLGWTGIFEDKDVVGFTSGSSGDLWFLESDSKETADYDARGVNHVAIKVEKSEDVDEIVTFLKDQNISMLFDTPKHRAEFASSEDQTYYQVMFESPDKVLFEIVYVGAKK